MHHLLFFKLYWSNIFLRQYISQIFQTHEKYYLQARWAYSSNDSWHTLPRQTFIQTVKIPVPNSAALKIFQSQKLERAKLWTTLISFWKLQVTVSLETEQWKDAQKGAVPFNWAHWHEAQECIYFSIMSTESHNSLGWKRSQKIISWSLRWEECGWDYLIPYSIIYWESPVMGTPPHPWEDCSINWLFSL